jgi:hypothetical protein
MSRMAFHGARAHGVVQMLRACSALTAIGGEYDSAIFTRGPQRKAGTVHRLYAGRLNRSKGVHWRLQSLMKITEQDGHLPAADSGSGH